MFSSKYKQEIDFIQSILTTAMHDLEGMTTKNVHDKSPRDLVTDNDIKIEQEIISAIRTHYPADKILSEETCSQTLITQRTWVIDPIDGTCNYVKNIPLYGIQLALLDNEEIAAAGIVLPYLNELYLAVINEGTTLNGQHIKVGSDSLNHSIVSFGDYNEVKPAESKLQGEIMHKLRFKIMKEKMFGAASIDFAFLASQRISGTYLIASHYWDILPGILICREAGVLICDEAGQPYQLDSKIILGANSKELIDLMKTNEPLC